ncbi:hypothetical protein [Pseudomonas nitroreducens]|uniref:hypothetical protein n=1 Tax=Pseudomonas nitroreducens TaxID=46680 RepID=UPI0028A6B607|nr:hypothetical protein [Pseudomonas nitroreducens]
MPVPANPTMQETAAYLKYPVVLSNSAWLSAVYLENPNRVGEMSLRLASVVQAAWYELKLAPDAEKFVFAVVHKQPVGRERVWISLSLTVVRPQSEPPYLHVELLDETSPEVDQD